MNYAFMVNDSISPSTQKNDCCCKNNGSSDVFQNMLTGYMESGSTEITVSHVEIKGTMLSNEEPELIGLEDMEEVTSRMKYLMDLMFIRNDIPTDPPVEIDYSYTRTVVTVKGDRDDVEEISQLINNDKELTEEIKKVHDILSAFINIYDALEFQEAHLANPDVKLETMKEKYPYLFDEDGKLAHPKMYYGDGIYFSNDSKAVEA